MRIKYEAISHVGAVRSQNEDMAYVCGQTLRNDSDSFEFEVPDNGIKLGAIVCDGLGGRADGDRASRMACEHFENFVDNLPDGLEPNEMILYYNQAYLLNSGDSQTHRLRHDNFRQVTKDHSEHERLQNPSAPSHLMYNCLGIDEAFVDVTPTRIIEGDRYLICSDGLSDYVSTDIIRRDSGSAEKLLQDALEQDAPDNVTIIIIDVLP